MGSHCDLVGGKGREKTSSDTKSEVGKKVQEKFEIKCLSRQNYLVIMFQYRDFVALPM